MRLVYRRGDFEFEAHPGPGGFRVNVSVDTGNPARGINGLVCRGVLQLSTSDWEQFVKDLNLKGEHDGEDRADGGSGDGEARESEAVVPPSVGAGERDSADAV